MVGGGALVVGGSTLKGGASTWYGYRGGGYG
jgi:hypothetical protein